MPHREKIPLRVEYPLSFTMWMPINKCKSQHQPEHSFPSIQKDKNLWKIKQKEKTKENIGKILGEYTMVAMSIHQVYVMLLKILKEHTNML